MPQKNSLVKINAILKLETTPLMKIDTMEPTTLSLTKKKKNEIKIEIELENATGQLCIHPTAYKNRMK